MPVVLIAVAVTVLLAGGAATGITLALRKSSKPGCPPSCSTINVVGDPLPEANTFTSSDLRFAVDYPKEWTITDQSGSSVNLHTQVTQNGKVLVDGFFAVKGVAGATDLDQLITTGRSLLPSSVQNLTPSGDIRGAHIAGVDGKGQRFTASDGGSPASVVIVAAQVGNLGVVAVGEDPVVGSDNSAPPVEGDLFDYVLTEFRWPPP